MKRKIFLLLNLFFLSTYFLVAQSVDQQKNITSIRISIADTSNNYLFLEQEKLKEIWGIFQNDELHEMRLRYQEPDNEFWNSEYYDMNFEGDVYVFKKKYNNSIHFLKPKIDVQNIYGRAKQYVNSKQFLIVIRKDSVIFDFRLECLGEDMQGNVPNRNKLGVPAKYFGDLKKLSSSIEKQFAEINSPAEVDSIIVFRCVIEVSGDMSSLILEAGERSAFSDAVKNALNSSQRTQTLREPKRWVPARISRGAVKSNIRIYARLHKDGSVTMSTTRVLGTISVWD
ncbi:hypothetical protein [Sphingobacterium arenae]|uniref:TonB C-terminal domain-containing protein n=1 Tax=Sphingobacterium arenae TaxID=1280598 RepID=A0ABR7XZG3_9SPHI|nr:hypothetical protein [Sphingobacterium arenae]MBD1424448.1 hypothetical protein [Sphingobacterium arenae]